MLTQHYRLTARRRFVPHLTQHTPSHLPPHHPHTYTQEGHLTADEYFNWTNECDLGSHLVKILVEICHIKFGLRPSNPELEGSVVNGYLNRFRKSGRCHGDTVYIIPSEWFTQWRVYTSQEVSGRV